MKWLFCNNSFDFGSVGGYWPLCLNCPKLWFLYQDMSMISVPTSNLFCENQLLLTQCLTHVSKYYILMSLIFTQMSQLLVEYWAQLGTNLSSVKLDYPNDFGKAIETKRFLSLGQKKMVTKSINLFDYFILAVASRCEEGHCNFPNQPFLTPSVVNTVKQLLKDTN